MEISGLVCINGAAGGLQQSYHAEYSFNKGSLWCDCTRKSNICSRSMCGLSLRLFSYLPSPSLQFGQEQATRRSLLLGGPSCSEELCTEPSCSGLMEEPDGTLPTATVTGDD